MFARHMWEGNQWETFGADSVSILQRSKAIRSEDERESSCMSRALQDSVIRLQTFSGKSAPQAQGRVIVLH